MEEDKKREDEERQNLKGKENVQNVLHYNKLTANFIKGNVCQFFAKILYFI